MAGCKQLIYGGGRKEKLIAAFLLLFSGQSVFLSAQVQPQRVLTRAEMEALVNPPLLKGADRLLRFDSLRLHFGVLDEKAAPVTVRYPFRNVSSQPVTLTRIATTCGCTVASFSKEPLAPGESSVITLTFRPANKAGTVDESAFVYATCSAKSPVAKLSLSGRVISADEWRHLPQAMGALRLSRREVVFEAVQPSQTPSERVVCANAGSVPLKIRAQLIPPYAQVHTEPEVIAPGCEADLVITLDGSRLPKPSGQEWSFSIILDGVQGRPSQRTLEVTVK